MTRQERHWDLGRRCLCGRVCRWFRVAGVRHVPSGHITSCLVTSSRVMCWFTISCHVLSCHAMSIHVMYAMSSAANRVPPPDSHLKARTLRYAFGITRKKKKSWKLDPSIFAHFLFQEWPGPARREDSPLLRMPQSKLSRWLSSRPGECP